MTEHRTPYLVDCQPEVTLTPLELRVQQLERELRIAVGVVRALLEAEGHRVCPCCGYSLKEDVADAALDNAEKV